MFIKGDIVLPTNLIQRSDLLNGLFHPAVVWEDFENGDFLGIMLTHTPPNSRFQNILMEKNHFKKDFSTLSSETYFVNQLFIKFKEWGPFICIDRLTENGILFLEERLTNINQVDFASYKIRI
jgi:hypothetical protein